MDYADATPPDHDEIAALARAAVARLPEKIRPLAEAVTLRVEDLADEAMLADLGIDNPFELTGLYDGIPLTEKSFADQPAAADTIWLFRRAILDEWVDRGDVELGALVAHVMVHELAHHFGWSDADIARIDRWWE